MGHISGIAARLSSVGFVFGKVPIVGGETSTLFLWSVFDNNFALSASFAFKR